MDGLISEQQQVEEIKKWLHENGTSIVAGIVIGLSVLFGWRAWSEYRQNTAQQASAAYSQFVASITGKDAAAAMQQGEALMARYDDTSYAAFAALVLARVKLEQGDTAAARAHLQWVVSNGSQLEFRQLAMLRLARVLAAEKKIDEAIKQVEAVEAGHYTVPRAELLGDLYRAKGDDGRARTAYQEALAALDTDGAALHAGLEIKLADVGGAPAREAAP